MYTECPSCNKQHRITVEKLRVSQGKFLCNRCYVTFDPVELLSQTSFFKRKNSIKTESELEKTGDFLSDNWRLCLALCAFVFLLQVYFFEGDALVQNKTIRPWLEKISSVVNYPLTPYNNSNEFSVLHVSFDPSIDNTFILKASIVNQADFSQNQPRVKLILNDFVGKTFAERIFYPKDYSKNTNLQIKPDMSAEIMMIIKAPAEKVGGFRFKLI
ncbi:MAG: zinc-ribbon domain-containing protein [Methylococcaceae bacterium]|nr:zinc-ribbon domain-containing protein [Methylococcaceae bacterium]